MGTIIGKEMNTTTHLNQTVNITKEILNTEEDQTINNGLLWAQKGITPGGYQEVAPNSAITRDDQKCKFFKTKNAGKNAKKINFVFK